VYLGISLIKLKYSPSFNGISCHGEIVLSPSLNTTRNESVPAVPVVVVDIAALAKFAILNERPSFLFLLLNK
jgi:hypothetical protein